MRSNQTFSMRTVGSIALHNWDVLLCFEILYRGFEFIVWIPFQRYLLSLLPGLVGQSYLGQNNFALIFRHPTAFFLLFGILLLTGLFLFFEITALFLYAEMGWKQERATLWHLINKTARKTMSLLHPKRLPAFLLLPVISLSVLSFISGNQKSIRIPEFIMEYIRQSLPLLISCVGIIAALHAVLFLYTFGFPELLLCGKSFTDSFRGSLKLLKKTNIRSILKIIFYLLLFWFISFAVAAVGLLLLAGCIRLFVGLETGRGQFQLYFSTLKDIWTTVMGVLSSVFLCAGIVLSYHQTQNDLRMEKEKRKWNAKRILLRTGSAVGVLMLLILFGESEIGGRVSIREHSPTQVVAHRAGAAFAPENSVFALHRAIEDEADMAEIDVQQLKDGTLIVMHDTNFKRTAGVDLSVREADYAMVQNFKNVQEPIPTLEEMLVTAKDRIQLMIELKSTSAEKNLVETTLAFIKKYDMEDQCMIASMDMELLKRVKELDPTMRTVYISVILLTEQYDLREVDAYSVETTALTADLVFQAHLQGKQVFAWTANSENTMGKILRCGADGLITDNVLLAQFTMETSMEDTLLVHLTDLLFPHT